MIPRFYLMVGGGIAIVALLTVVLLQAERRGADKEQNSQLRDALGRIEAGQEGAIDALGDLDNGLEPSDIVRGNDRDW